MRERIGLIEAMGLRPYDKTLREIRLALGGDATLPPARFGLSSLRQFRPRYAVALWLGQKPEGRRVPITNLFNYRQPPPEEGWSVRVTDVEDFQGGSSTYDSHNATDFAVPPGTSVVAAAPGRVIRVSSEFHRGGWKVFLDHGRGLVTTYNHLARPLVVPGQTVLRGELIARSGYSGIDALFGFPWTPPHVHFNVWLDGAYVDPFTPKGSTAPSMWRRHNDPVPARDADLKDDAFAPTAWDEAALDSLCRACRDEATQRDIESAPSLEQKAGAALFHACYFPTRFRGDATAMRAALFGAASPREPRLDLPFSFEDYDGALLPG